MQLDHVAVLVGSIEEFVDKHSLKQVNPIEDFPGEGTRELYLGESNQYGRLLLMQAVGPGPYKRSFEKRGEGLHHIAFNSGSRKNILSSAIEAGWLQVPGSVDFSESMGIWLCKSGVPTLIEINPWEDKHGASYIEEIRLPVSAEMQRLFDVFENSQIGFAEVDESPVVKVMSACLTL